MVLLNCSALAMVNLSCGLLPLGSLKVCGVVVCVSGVLGSMLSSLTPCTHITSTLFPCPSPLPTLLVPPLTSSPRWLSRVFQHASSNDNCSRSTLASVVPLELYTRTPLQKGVTQLYKNYLPNVPLGGPTCTTVTDGTCT